MGECELLRASHTLCVTLLTRVDKVFFASATQTHRDEIIVSVKVGIQTINLSHRWLLPINCLLFMSGCGSDQTEEPPAWQVTETRPLEGAPLGLYTVELQIEQDGCSPSLASIVAQTDNWPPSRTLVGGSLRRERPPFISLYIYLLRLVNAHGYIIHTDSQGRPETKLMVSEKRAMIAHATKPCISEWRDTGQLDEDLTIKMNDQGDIIVEQRVQWSEDLSCSQSPGAQLDPWPWRPQEACTESYTMIYRLEEACPADMEFVSTGLTGVRGAGGMSYPQPKVDELISECGLEVDR